MSNGVAVDMSQFQAAFKQYLDVTSKTMVDALNGKSKDLCLRAAQNTPKSKMSPAQFKEQQASPQSIAAVAKRIYEKQGGIGGRTSLGRIYRATKATMAKRQFKPGYMKSSYVKAARKFVKVGDASKVKPSSVPEYDGARAVVKEASKHSNEAASLMQWVSTSSKDLRQKQAMVSAAMAKAVPIVTADMLAYMQRKMNKTGKQVSGK